MGNRTCIAWTSTRSVHAQETMNSLPTRAFRAGCRHFHVARSCSTQNPAPRAIQDVDVSAQEHEHFGTAAPAYFPTPAPFGTRGTYQPASKVIRNARSSTPETATEHSHDHAHDGSGQSHSHSHQHGQLDQLDSTTHADIAMTSRPPEPRPSPPSSEAAPSSDVFKYCGDLLRRSDYEHYLVSLLQPSAPARQTYWALRAFNIELARIRENVSNDALGKIKMQWWKDAVDECFKGNPGRAPVMLALYQAMMRTPLSKSFLLRLVKERSANLSVSQYPTLASMETYAENTASCLLYLHLQTLGVQSVQADHVASHLGKAAGIATLLRGAAFQAKERRWYLPSEVMAKHGVSQEAVFREGPSSALADAVLEIATLANSHLQHARQLLSDTPAEAQPGLLSIIPTEMFLGKLEKVDFNLFDSRLYRRDWNLPMVLWWKAKRGL